MKRIARVLSWVSREVPAWANRHKVWAGIVIVLALLAVVIYLPRVPGVGPRSGREAEGEFRGHLLQAVGGLVLGVGAYFTARTFALNRQGQITERFTRAIDQLGNEKSLDVRLGGIYGLERIAQESDRDHWPIVEVLTAFVREQAPWIKPETAEVQSTNSESKGPRADIQAVLTVLGRRNREHEAEGQRLSLSNTDLRRAVLLNAHLERALLVDTNLKAAVLNDAHLQGADLSRSNLEAAELAAVQLQDAHLFDVRLDSAYLGKTHLENANLTNAGLENAYLPEAHLEGAELFGAHLQGATLRGAYLQGASLTFADLQSAKLEGAHLDGANLSAAHLEGVDLEEALGLTSEQVKVAFTDEATKLPEYLDREVKKTTE